MSAARAGSRRADARALDVAIVGNGAAAAEAAAATRHAGYRGPIDLFADNALPPYNPMLGTYFASGAIPQELCFPFGGMEFYDRHGVRAHLDTPVETLSPSAQTLTDCDGVSYSYRTCLVASGAHTAIPPVPGLDLPGVYSLRTFSDAVRLKEAIAACARRAAAGDRPPRALVLGASFAGVKVAELLREAGIDVCIVEKEACVLPLAAHAECACALADHLRGQGYTLRLAAALEGVEADGDRLVARFGNLGVASDPDGAEAASRNGEAPSEGADGGSEEADLIVLCTGSRPNLGFVAGDEVAIDAGLIVDEHLRTSAPGLYAAGDVAQALNPLSAAHEIVALWANARRQGRVAGLNMGGGHAEYPGNLPSNLVRVGDLLFASAGSLAGSDTLEFESKGRGLTACAFKDGRLSGFNIVGAAAAAGPLMQAVARGWVTDRVSLTDRVSRETVMDWARRMAWTSSNVD